MNPYESPKTECNGESLSENAQPPRAGWLIFVSVLLAILLEVLPTEVDVLVTLLQRRDLQRFLAFKSAFLVAILLPLLVYVALNGWRALRVYAVRVGIILAIVVLQLIFNVFMIVDMLHPK